MLVGDYLKNVVLEKLTVALPDTLRLYNLLKLTLDCSLSVNGLKIADGVIGHLE